MRGPIAAVFCAGPHRKFIGVGFAQHHHAGGFQPFDGGGCKGRDVLFKDAAAAGGAHAGGGEYILDGQRQAEQRRILATPQTLVSDLCLGQRPLRRHGQIRSHLRVNCGDAVKQCLGQRLRCKVTCTQTGAGLV